MLIKSLKELFRNSLPTKDPYCYAQLLHSYAIYDNSPAIRYEISSLDGKNKISGVYGSIEQLAYDLELSGIYKSDFIYSIVSPIKTKTLTYYITSCGVLTYWLYKTAVQCSAVGSVVVGSYYSIYYISQLY